MKLADKTVLVTGASAGIGHATAHATALAFAKQGANLLITARREERLLDLRASVEAIGGNAVFLAGDATEERTARRCVDLAIKTFGSLDVLIANAGAGNYKDLVDMSTVEYDHLMDANMKSSFLFARYAAPVMIGQRSGQILFVSSIAGLQGYAGEAVYCATKFAQVGFAQALDAELRKHNIKVCVVCPGGTKSEFALGSGRTEDSISNSRMMEPAEVADAIVYASLQPSNVRIPQLIIRHMN
jgi:3-oxoacyl-[acyl-carrier protein] reductase